jgi:iron-sulfur cluster assembly protein
MTEQTNATRSGQALVVTPAAVEELKRLMTQEEGENVFVRLGVTSGGCSGFSYAMHFDTDASDLDREFDFDGLKVRVDLKALMYINGSTLDYKGGLLGGGFTFDNPNAKRSCGCGSSFSC